MLNLPRQRTPEERAVGETGGTTPSGGALGTKMTYASPVKKLGTLVIPISEWRQLAGMSVFGKTGDETSH